MKACSNVCGSITILLGVDPEETFTLSSQRKNTYKYLRTQAFITSQKKLVPVCTDIYMPSQTSAVSMCFKVSDFTFNSMEEVDRTVVLRTCVNGASFSTLCCPVMNLYRKVPMPTYSVLLTTHLQRNYAQTQRQPQREGFCLCRARPQYPSYWVPSRLEIRRETTVCGEEHIHVNG